MRPVINQQQTKHLLLAAAILCVSGSHALHLHARNCEGSLRHVTLSVGPDPATSVIVSFASTTSPTTDVTRASPPIGGVVIGKSELEEDNENNEFTLTRLVVEEEPALWYNATEWFSETHVEEYTSPFYHHVLVDDLEPDTFYSYQVVTREEMSSMKHLEKILSEQTSSKQAAQLIADEIDEKLLDGEQTEEHDGDKGFRRRQEELNQRHQAEKQQQQQRRRLSPPPYDSTQCKCPDPNQIRSFRTAPKVGDSPSGKNLKFAVIGDIGQFAHSQETLNHLKHHHGTDVVDCILLAGDLAYPEMNHKRWDTFLDFLDDYPYVDQVPLQITPGNHDIDKADHNGIIYEAYETRFRMPRIQPAEKGIYVGPDADGRLNMDNPPYPFPYEYGNAYYSFKYGAAHVIVLSSYSSVETDSKQYAWFVNELTTEVNRTVTPWLFVMMHCPIYNTFEKHQRDNQVLATRENLEELFVEHYVNVVFTGHVHAYLRTSPVANGTLSPDGPIHIVMGAGGRAAEAAFLSEEPEEWVELRDASIYGYGLVEIYNSTHLRWDWVHTGSEEHANTVKGSDDIELPPGGVDGVVLENQYLMKK